MDRDKTAQTQLTKDALDLNRLGYVQELFRDMGGFSNFAVSFSVISILTGATQLYGYGLQHGGPLQMSLGWGIVSFFTLLVALSMAELASAYPTAGALYHWSSFLGGRSLGWTTACFNSIGQFAILAGIDYGLAQFLIELMKWPTTYGFVFGLYGALLVSHAILNHVGIRVVSWLNGFSAWYHIGVVLMLFAALSLRGFAQPIRFMSTFNRTDHYTPSYSFLIGLLLAQWTLTGYDASAHVTEETVNPRKNAPWGIFLAVTISILFGWIMLIAVTLSIPDLNQATAFGDGAFTQILKLRLGEVGGTIVVGLVAGAMWLCGLSAMTSASRMVYAFARDGGLPWSTVWAKVSTKYRTPSYAIWGLSLLAMVLTLSVKLYSAVVSIATISLYISYGLPIFARLYARWNGYKDEVGPWNLGRWSNGVAFVALAWICMITILFILPPNGEAGGVLLAGSGCLLALWFFYVRHRFSGPKYQLEEVKLKELRVKHEPSV